MATDYNWKQYHDRSVRNAPANVYEEELAEQQSSEIVAKIIEGLQEEPHFRKRVLKKLAPHVLKAVDKPPQEEPEEEDTGASLV
jgi:hypothetical protein